MHVHTVPATTPGSAAVASVLSDVRKGAIAPSAVFVDHGDTSASARVEQAKQGTEMIGSLQESTSWQAQAGWGYGLNDVEVDWHHQCVRCPQGTLSQPLGSIS